MCDRKIGSDRKIMSEKRYVNKWNVAAMLLVFIAAPLTIVISFMLLGSSRYFFMSALLAIIVLLVFFFIFEGQKPDARTLIIISVMSAVAIVGRAIFFFTPNFKPTLAVVILTGICFGRNVGFITGATSAFVSNFIFGQGPWTPWQMLAMGVVGYLAGLFFDDGKKGRRAGKYNKHSLRMTVAYCIFGFAAAFFIYGVIVDLWTILGFFGSPTLKTAMTVYTMAAFFNMIHGISTVMFLLILVIPMKKKLDRIKVKYGLIGKG